MEKETLGFNDIWLRYDNNSEFKYSYRYPRWCVTADTVVFRKHTDTVYVLLIRRGNDPYRGMWALPGGFVNLDEDVTEGARRELKEETGISVNEIHQSRCYSSPGRDPRGPVLTIAHYAFAENTDAVAGDDASETQWFDIKSLPALAFDHAQIIHDAFNLSKAYAKNV